MLLLLIPIVWLLIVAVYIGVCRVAARGDGVIVSHTEASTPAENAPRERVLWSEGPGAGASDLLPTRSETAVGVQSPRAARGRERGSQCTPRH